MTCLEEFGGSSVKLGSYGAVWKLRGGTWGLGYGIWACGFEILVDQFTIFFFPNSNQFPIFQLSAVTIQ